MSNFVDAHFAQVAYDIEMINVPIHENQLCCMLKTTEVIYGTSSAFCQEKRY